MPSLRRLLLLLLSAVIAPQTLLAHSLYQSAVLLDISARGVTAELQLPIDRLSISFRQTVDQAHLAGQREALRSYIQTHIHPVASDRRPFAVSVGSIEIRTVEGAPYLVAGVAMTPPSGATLERFTLNYDVIAHEIVTHVVLVSIRRDFKMGIQPNDPLLVGIIRGQTLSVEIDRTKRP